MNLRTKHRIDIKYKVAGVNDASIIADLHTRSWQRHYRGIYSDTYLDDQLPMDRQKVWKQRFAEMKETQYVVKAMLDDEAIGFACTFLDYDPEFGALVDNLHVLEKYQGQGIGRQLLQRSARWVQTMDPPSGIYLYVLNQNHAAKAFYGKLNATFSELIYYDSDHGGKDTVLRCSWNTEELIQACEP